MKIMNMARIALVGGATVAMIAMPAVAGAQREAGEVVGEPITGVELGLYYGEEIGLGTRSLQETIASIIRVILSLLGIVAVVIILMGGFKWMTAGGNEENVTKAKKLIINGIIGLAIILMAFAISKFVIESLTSAVAG